MTKTVISTHTFKGTWLGRPGIATTFHYDKNRFGKRVSVITWQDDDSAEVKAIEGDGRKADFKVYGSAQVANFADAQKVAFDLAERFL